MSDLADKLRKARESAVDVDTFKFRIRRPTELEYLELQGRPKGRAILKFLIGWEGVTGLALGLPGGDAHPVEFDPDVAFEWLTDRIDLLQPLSDGVIAAYTAHEAKLEVAKKN